MDNNQQSKEMTCPVCSAQCEALVQYCEQCGWHFELFLSQPDQQQQYAYQQRLERHRTLWERSNNEPKKTVHDVPIPKKTADESTNRDIQINHGTNEAQVLEQSVNNEQVKKSSSHFGAIIYVLFFSGCIYAITPFGFGISYSEQQYNLGFKHKEGIDVERDFFKANGFFKDACNSGDLRGCTQLGLSYDYGNGVKKDMFKANMFYRKACDGGELIGCNNLGISYQYGLDVNKDLNKARRLFKKACDGDILAGCTNLLK